MLGVASVEAQFRLCWVLGLPGTGAGGQFFLPASAQVTVCRSALCPSELGMDKEVSRADLVHVQAISAQSQPGGGNTADSRSLFRIDIWGNVSYW